jgi:thiamine-phosphate pyrophosphorylase
MQATQGGANVVQLREKDLSAAELFTLGVRLREVTKNRALLLINDRVDVAQACGADGIQLPENGLPTPVARWVLGRHALVGRSVHSVEAAAQAEGDGADMVVVGPVFQTASKPDAAPVGLELVREIANGITIPVLAIGGITPENAGDVIRAGAAGVAVISAICAADDPRAAAKALVEAMGEAWRERLLARAKESA